jgi:xanthine dehydrogenase YagT iron-sulfur-binding subunit
MSQSDESGRSSGVSRRRFFNTVAAGTTEAALLTALPEQADAQEIVEGSLVKVALKVNGETHTLMVEPRWTLLSVLRERLEITGTKQGCERGECGACTVLMDGVPRYACMTLALEAAGSEITTIEGLTKGTELGPVQSAFRDHDAYQCGFCSSGQIMNAEGFLRKNPSPTIEQIREGVSGNLCRCGAYANIFKAVESAAALKKSER